jgi:hydroxypyruvate isomerase
MPKLCANLTMMFQEYDFLDRFSAAADAGFSGVEILFPYACDTEKMATLLDLYQLEFCLINLFPGYFLNNTWQAADLMDEIAHPVVKLQLDIFHYQMTHGDVLGAITDLFDRVGHLQTVGVPDRHEPDVGGRDYRAVLSHLDNLEYNGWVGCEYSPRSGIKEGLSWIRSYQS